MLRLPEVDHIQISFLDDLFIARLETLANVKSCRCYRKWWVGKEPTISCWRHLGCSLLELNCCIDWLIICLAACILFAAFIDRRWVFQNLGWSFARHDGGPGDATAAESVQSRNLWQVVNGNSTNQESDACLQDCIYGMPVVLKTRYERLVLIVMLCCAALIVSYIHYIVT